MENISLDFNDKKPRGASADFLDLIRIISKMEACSNKWVYYSTCDSTLTNELDSAGKVGSPLCADEISHRVARLPIDNSGAFLFRATTTLKLTGALDFDHYAEEDQYFVVDVETFDPSILGRGNGPYKTFASLGVRPIHHFLGNKRPSELIEARADMLLYLSAMACSVLSPPSMHTYRLDSSTGWPLNSYMSYFSSNQECAKQIEAIVASWTSPQNSVGTVKGALENAELAELLSFNRSREQRQQVCERMNIYSNMSPSVTTFHVEAVRTSGRFDIVDRPESGRNGFSVLEYPDFLSRYVDAFVFRVLDKACGCR